MAAAGEAVLIVPGYRGSGESHWQSWLHHELAGSRVLSGVSWHEPVLADWAGRVRDEITRAPAPLWIVAHSFGCLATVIAVEDRPQNVAGVILAAPADPQRFHLLGLGRVDDRRLTVKTLADVLPTRALGVPGVLVASENDPWMSLSDARQWAQAWDIGVVNAGTPERWGISIRSPALAPGLTCSICWPSCSAVRCMRMQRTLPIFNRCRVAEAVPWRASGVIPASNWDCREFCLRSIPAMLKNE